MADTDADAGTIAITGDTLTIRNGAEINVGSLGQGDAGNLNLIFDRVWLDHQGQLLAEVNGGSQGNIHVTAHDLLLLRHGSSITTNATGLSTGGNITLDAAVILGIADENSDIVANALQGNGGTIMIQTQGLLGLKFSDRLTPDSDITASSEFGVNGTVAILKPREEITSDTLEFSETFSNTDQQITTTCEPGNSAFILTGRGGIPHHPSDFHHHRPWIDLRDLTETTRDSAAVTLPAQALDRLSLSASIQETTAIEIAPNGIVQLTASDTQNEPHYLASCTSRRPRS